MFDPVIANIVDVLRVIWLDVNDAVGVSHHGWSVILYNGGWMVGNTVLAWIAYFAGRLAFDPKHQPAVLRWAMVALTIAFLPNAPYVVTDLAHIHRDMELIGSWRFATLVLSPTYFILALSGDGDPA